MVLQNARSQNHAPHAAVTGQRRTSSGNRSPRRVPPRPELSRIVAISGALALNLAVLLLLLVPAGLQRMPVTAQQPTWYLPVERLEPTPPPPPTVDVIRPQDKVIEPRPRQQTDAPQLPVPAVSDQVVVPDGSVQADPISDTATPATAVDLGKSSGPIAGVRLEYSSAPPPAYPREQLLAGIEGTVMLRVLVGTDGKPLEVAIARSSGNRKLDEAARRFVLRNWTFQPATRDGHAIQASGLVPIDFRLH